MPDQNNSQSPAPALPVPAEQTMVGVFASPSAFEHGQRMARALASSTMVPPQYRDNLPNVLVALDVAIRAKLPPMMVLQGLNVIQGRPSWSAQFIVAAINGCGLFSPLRYEMRGAEGTDAWGCRACATELGHRHPTADGREILEGPWVTIQMAKAEGWYGRNGSKWQTMPEVMLRWRAASFFGRLYAAHILAGMQSTDELRDAGEIDVTPIVNRPLPPVAAGGYNPFADPAPNPAASLPQPGMTTVVASVADIAAARAAGAPDPDAGAAAPRRGRGRPPRVDPPAGAAVPETPLARQQREAAAAAAAARAATPAADAPLPPVSGLEPAPAQPARDPLDPGF